MYHVCENPSNLLQTERMDPDHPHDSPFNEGRRISVLAKSAYARAAGRGCGITLAAYALKGDVSRLQGPLVHLRVASSLNDSVIECAHGPCTGKPHA
jgi:hypothetical protein